MILIGAFIWRCKMKVMKDETRNPQHAQRLTVYRYTPSSTRDVVLETVT